MFKELNRRFASFRPRPDLGRRAPGSKSRARWASRGNFALRKTFGEAATESAEENPPPQRLRRARPLSGCNGPPPYGRETQFFVNPGAASLRDFPCDAFPESRAAAMLSTPAVQTATATSYRQIDNFPLLGRGQLRRRWLQIEINSFPDIFQCLVAGLALRPTAFQRLAMRYILAVLA